MKAMVQDTYGSAEVLQLRDIDKPEIGDHDVLVHVRAAGVNPADWAVMSGLPYIARPVYGLRKPKNPVRGTDVAGQVEAVGPSVTRFRPTADRNQRAMTLSDRMRARELRGWSSGE
jgi:NADPH:quinone reductase-like Zn-dependent oxidoreductase